MIDLTLYSKLTALPEQLKAEVLDFIDFLMAKVAKEQAVQELNPMKSERAQNQSSFERAFGAFKSNQSADELIAEIRNSRTFTRQTEEF